MSQVHNYKKFSLLYLCLELLVVKRGYVSGVFMQCEINNSDRLKLYLNKDVYSKHKNSRNVFRVPETQRVEPPI